MKFVIAIRKVWNFPGDGEGSLGVGGVNGMSIRLLGNIFPLCAVFHHWNDHQYYYLFAVVATTISTHCFPSNATCKFRRK